MSETITNKQEFSETAEKLSKSFSESISSSADVDCKNAECVETKQEENAEQAEIKKPVETEQKTTNNEELPKIKNSNINQFMSKTEHEFREALIECRNIFINKIKDYGVSWKFLRPMSVTDQLLIKATRIRNLEDIGISKVGEGIYPEFIAIVNYGIIALIQLETDYSAGDLNVDDAIRKYDKFAKCAFELMMQKNHDYNEAWRLMRTCSYTDFILTKISRNKMIEMNDGKTIISEGVDSNYLDIINYAVFGIIKLTENGQTNA